MYVTAHAQHVALQAKIPVVPSLLDGASWPASRKVWLRDTSDRSKIQELPHQPRGRPSKIVFINLINYVNIIFILDIIF